MKNQSPNAWLPSHQLAIIPYHQTILLPNIDTQSPKPGNTTRTNPTLRKSIFTGLLEELQRHFTTQELITVTFAQIMCITSVSHLVMGFQLLDKTVLSSTSISPVAMSLFKYSLEILTSFSMTSMVDEYSRFFKAPIREYTVATILIAHFFSPVAERYKRIFYYMTDFLYLVCVGDFSTRLGTQGWLLRFGLYWSIEAIVFPITFRVDTSSETVLLVSALATTFWAVETSLDLHSLLHKSIQKLVPLATARVKSAIETYKIRKLVKYAIGLIGTVLFQNFFRLTTFCHVKAFMYLATSWLANLALLNASDDFGILNFLLGNMILGSTVNQYGLKITTWYTYGVCLFLYILGIKLKSMNTSENIVKSPTPPFLFWIFYCGVVFDSVFNLFHQL